jgi:hypothetical protein
MITAGQALMIALTAAAGPNGKLDAGNAIVEQTGDSFTVSIVADAPTTLGARDSAAFVMIDKNTGNVIARKIVPLSDCKLPSPHPDSGLVPISVAMAYERALAAIPQGTKYDQYGRLTVTLDDNRYIVTFPLAVQSPTTRGPSFAVQIWIDARTGANVGGLSAS